MQTWLGIVWLSQLNVAAVAREVTARAMVPEISGGGVTRDDMLLWLY